MSTFCLVFGVSLTSEEKIYLKESFENERTDNGAIGAGSDRNHRVQSTIPSKHWAVTNKGVCGVVVFILKLLPPNPEQKS